MRSGKNPVIRLCSQECYDRTAEFQRFGERFLWLFILGLVAGTLVILLSIAFPERFISIMGMSFLIIGSTLTVFPFLTPESYEIWGIRKANRIGRSIGIVMAAIGAVFIMFDVLALS